MTGQSRLPLFLKVCGVIMLIVDLLILNYRVFFSDKKVENISSQTTSMVAPARFSPGETSPVTLEMVADIVKEATATISQKVDALSSEPVPSPLVITNTISTKFSQPREMYIPLGTGSVSNTDWTDLPGVEAYVAPDNYGTIKEMYFEASIRIPTGNGRVYARLKNVTDTVSLFESEVSNEGSTGELVSSGKLPLPQSTKLYRVQLKSTLGAQAVLDNARIKLFVQ